MSEQDLDQQVIANMGGQEEARDVRHLRVSWNNGDLRRSDGDDAGFAELGGGETAVNNNFKALRKRSCAGCAEQTSRSPATSVTAWIILSG